MAILGKAIASHLRNRTGLYSVELPASLTDEMSDLVAGCNQTGTNRAFLVTEQPPAGITVPVVTWAEILRWRTQDDRVFVWARGSREPDTSFRSVVRPFLANRFPGISGGECTLDELARFTIAEIWTQRGYSKGSDAFLAFTATAVWLSGLLQESFEEAGSTPTVHWSDRFLEHWAGVLRQLDTRLAPLSGPPLPRHAWELLRLAGIPVPAQIAGAGNPFLQPPNDLPERDWRKLAKFWHEVVDEFILPVAVLLSALDRQVAGAGDVSSWRGLPWTTASRLSTETPAPIVGSAVFTGGSPSMLSPTAPPYPITKNPAWWGVTTDHLQKAINQLQSKNPLQPSFSCTAIVQGPDPVQGHWLLTRQGALSAAHTARKWRARLDLASLELVFKEEWRRLFVSPLAPNSSEDGDAWINPDDVVLRVTGSGADVTRQTISVAAGNQLAIGFDLSIEFAASRDKSSGALSGNWNAERSVKLTAKVSHYLNGGWTAPQTVDSALDLIIPSPFSPTIAASSRKAFVAPDSGDSYLSDPAATNWVAESTPDIVLPEEGRYSVTIYDGRVSPSATSFSGPAVPTADGRSLPADPDRSGMFVGDIDLDDGDMFSGADTSTFDIAVVKVKERSTNLSSGLLSALRGSPAGRRKFSAEARNSFLGRYQAQVVHALARQLPQRPNSLYQYVASSVESVTVWPAHRGTPAPEFLFAAPSGWNIPGIQGGPSSALAASQTWADFMSALQKICDKVGIDAGASEFWLSGFDPSIVGLDLVREYVAAHRELIRAGGALSIQDRFWASYPLSVVIVEGRAGASFGQLLAVLLSPLHPVRLAWSAVLATVARMATTDPNLLGIAESWNFPNSGLGVSPAGQELPMLAVPTDPGVEEDFAAWSALTVLTTGGLVELPPSAAGLPLPWGGRTGVNERVVEQAIKDYTAANPHLSALEVDIRSVSPAPRSREIDEAVLTLIGTGALDQVSGLGGATRVWDSTHREGKGPGRDRLFVLRDENDGDWPFEWRRYTPPNIPQDSDLALVENSSVHIAVTRGTTHGVIGALPLRRFLPAVVKDLVLDQNFSAQPGDDIIGLSALLAELEYPVGPNPAALHASPQPGALGIGLGARWEVLGTFNIDPSLLSSLVASTSQTGNSRLLWEWRPSWLSRDPKGGELAKRPYYVVAKTPASMVRALEYVQGFTPAQGAEMLTQLGRSGIGLASLYATGGSHESAAAGFFYALRLIMPPLGHALPSDWPLKDGWLGILPIDPIEPILSAAAGQPLAKRCDLLAVRVGKSGGQSTEICFRWVFT